MWLIEKQVTNYFSKRGLTTTCGGADCGFAAIVAGWDSWLSILATGKKSRGATEGSTTRQIACGNDRKTSKGKRRSFDFALRAALRMTSLEAQDDKSVVG